MAEQIPIPTITGMTKTDHRRELILLVVLGVGALVYSFGAMAMYAEPSAKPLEITLQARPRTEPHRLDAAGDTGAVAPEASTPAPQADTSPAPPAPAAPQAPPTVAAAAPAQVSDAPETRATTSTPPAPLTAPAPAVAAPAPAEATTTAPAAVTTERVRILKTRVGDKTIEIHDFTRGVEYRGEIHDFRSGEVPRWIREREKGSGR